MKIKLAFFLLVLSSNLLLAQQWIVSHTKLYTEATKQSDSIGVLVRGAAVTLLNNNSSEYVKVIVDNGMEGYVKRSLVRRSLNIADSYDKTTPQPFIENDGLYGSPHLFINAASLRGRTKPSIDSKIGKIFTMGQVVRVNFYPYNTEAWVNVNNYYVQQKYLGKRPVLSQLIIQFDEVPKDSITQRETISQRIYEFLWKSNTHHKIVGLHRCLEMARQLKDEKLIDNLLLDIVCVEEREKPYTFEELHNLEKNKKNYLVLNGLKIYGYQFSLKDLLKAKGKPIEKVKEEEDCCFAGNMLYRYKDAEFIVDEKEGIVEISWISLKSNSYVVNGFRINSKISKKEFVNRLAKLFYYNGLYPDNYDFPFLDYAALVVDFKEEKPYKFNFYSTP